MSILGRFFVRWYRNISIKEKLYFVICTMAFLIAAELLILYFTIHTLSSTRAFVGGEGLYSKAQKEAVYHLIKFSTTGKEDDYSAFNQFISIPEGDRDARLELEKPIPDEEKVYKSFLQARNHPGDIAGMILLFKRFRHVYYIDKAVNAWARGDSLIKLLRQTGVEIHIQINAALRNRAEMDRLLLRVDTLNTALTKLEDEFSFTLGEGSRWLENLILKILFVVALTVELTGLLLTISVSTTISRGVNEIIRATTQVGQTDFIERANVRSNDEIGKLALSFNKMMDDLQALAEKRNQTAAELNLKSEELKQSNTELEHFAYAISHDLREPLRSVSSYMQLLQLRYQDKLDAEANEFIHFAVNGAKRMDELIQDLLTYSRLGNADTPLEQINCNDVLMLVLENLKEQITTGKANIEVEDLPEIRANRTMLMQLFQNLIGNAIKFNNSDNPRISIRVKKEEGRFIFSVADNGIGIDPKFAERVFVIFQRLHTHSDYEGTGIGLAMCKRIVEKHNGKIWVESQPGKGSVFYFTLS
ncbi:MAG: ATP-binding protein [Bacteroidia bacterium]